MKYLIYFLIGILLVSTIVAAPIKTFVTDNANILNPTEESQITSVLSNIYNSKTAQIAVVTVQSLEGRDIESYALELAQGNLGDSSNNGMLLLVAVEDREYRFEVGRGLEPVLTDARTGNIGRDFLVENFRAGQYGKGILEATAEVSRVLGVESGIKVTPKKTRRGNNLLPLLVFAIIILFSFASGFSSRRTYRRRDRFFDAALMAGWMFGGRGRSRGGFGGGFGGFGSGGFGGGGSSGGW